ncbi:MMPL family transporter [Streptomyces sp. SID3343]|uniref:MMPL family transporter n=1 Tax=Streptomyces sp. SID3343 TaxID=2690260 RepID=UPI00136D2704|nr:MMPL family transporter [Streptomyces sp. SID3343]MYW01887.1 MMPL family transporter [Streptomyces sp. SID3343]
MSALARWCHEHRLSVVFLWAGLLVALALSALFAGAAYSNDSKMPDTESATAIELMRDNAPDSAGASGTVVWRAGVGELGVRERMTAALEHIALSPGVAAVVSPYTEAGARQIAADGRTAYATVNFAEDEDDLAESDVDAVRDIATAARTATLHVELGGGVFTEAPAVSKWSELVGIGLACLLLLLVFRSAWAAVLPVITAVAGVVTALMATMLLGHVMTLADVTPTLGALIGLGVGIDYALFIVNRHRRNLMTGVDVASSIAKAMNTSGRAVVFAGLTVVVALLGMLVLGIGILNGMAVGAALTVLLTVSAAVTLLPALLGMLGLRVLGRRQRRDLVAGGPRPNTDADDGVWARWAERVRRHPKRPAIVAVLIMAIVAIPALSIRLGAADAGNDPASSTSRKAYDMLADGFGPGFNGPLVLAAQTPDDTSRRALSDLVDRLGATDGVAAVTAPPAVPGTTFSVVSVVPNSSPQSARTGDLIDHVRDDIVPAAEDGSRLRVYVGGTTASSNDFAATLIAKLPLFIGIIVALGFLLLTAAFRSLLVPLIGALTNILTLGAALGAIVVVFQHGFGTELLGVGSAGPVEAFVPILVIGVMFGLSMDYQVFLVSRMHEEWSRTGDNHRAVRVGQAETGQVVAVAAAIMFSVFAAFAGGGMRVIATFGVGLAAAVALDAIVVRMLLVPALMHLCGRANWWLPKWLDKVLPRISVEGAPESEQPARPADEPVSAGR